MKKTVITYGVFDMFHEGHRKLLERAKALGDFLIVGITTDQYAYERGKLCLVDPLEQRLENVKKCGFADSIIIEDHDGQKIEDVQKYGVRVFAIGDDWLGKFDYMKKYCEVVYLARTPDISSSILRNSRYPFLNIGIIGSGRIVSRMIQEAGAVKEIRFRYVYNPGLENSVSLYSLLEKYSYLQKVRTPEKLFDLTDAVYIAAPHAVHYEYAKKALEAGRHVLCEKPLALRESQARELFEIARKNNLVLMETVKTAYCPGFLRLISLVESGVIGEVKDVDCSFTRLTPGYLREWTDLENGGSFTEFGSYVMLPIIKLLGTKGLHLTFDQLKNENGIDYYTKMMVSSDRAMGLGRCGIGVKTEGELLISGTKGYIQVKAPWWKTADFEIRYEDPSIRVPYHCEYKGEGFRYELADFLYRVQGYSGREYKLRDEESIFMASAMEQFLSERRKPER